MTSCQLFADDLEALHDGELSRESAAAVRRHAASCPACAAELDRLAAIAALLRERAEAPAPPGLWEELAPRLGAVDAALPPGAPVSVGRPAAVRPPSRPAARSRAGAPGWRRILPPLAAAAGLAGLVLLLFGRTPPAQALNVVRSLDTFGAPVLVMPDDAEGATVIWLLDEPGATADDVGDPHAPAP